MAMYFFFPLWLMPLQCIGLITTIQLWLPPFFPELYKIMDVSAEFLHNFLVKFALALAMSHIV